MNFFKLQRKKGDIFENMDYIEIFMLGLVFVVCDR